MILRNKFFETKRQESYDSRVPIKYETNQIV
jgi:hypothetical protein